MGAGNTQNDQYDNLGDVISQTDRSRVVHHYSYDAVGRLMDEGVVLFNRSVPQNSWKIVSETHWPLFANPRWK